MSATLVRFRQETSPEVVAVLCEHRTVSKNGQIVCSKIIEGDNEVSPSTCRTCPFKAVNCAHLRFALRQSSPSPLIVRFNGRTEVWNDDPPELGFEQAACAARVLPIAQPRQCAGCALRQAIRQPVTGPDSETPPLHRPRSRRPCVADRGRVVAFPSTDIALAAS